MPPSNSDSALCDMFSRCSESVDSKNSAAEYCDEAGQFILMWNTFIMNKQLNASNYLMVNDQSDYWRLKSMLNLYNIRMDC